MSFICILSFYFIVFVIAKNTFLLHSIIVLLAEARYMQCIASTHTINNNLLWLNDDPITNSFSTLFSCFKRYFVTFYFSYTIASSATSQQNAFFLNFFFISPIELKVINVFCTNFHLFLRFFFHI